MNKKNLVHKPNRTTMITNEEITVTQKKAYNVILYQAQKQVKLNQNQILFNYSISEIKEKAGIKSTNNTELKKNIEKLKNISVETVYENGDWLSFNLIAQAQKQGDGLEIQLPEAIRQALINNDYYTTLDLMIMKNLEGKYAIILYEMAMRYNKIQIPELTIEEFRKLTGTEHIKSYDGFGVNRQKVIEPAIKEINTKTDIKLSYKAIKTGRKVTSIKFKVAVKQLIKKNIVKKTKESSSLTFEKDELLEICRIQNDEIKKIIQKYADNTDISIIKSNIEYTNKKAKTNYEAYLKNALEKDYAKSIRNKKNKEKRKLENQEKEKVDLEQEKQAFDKYFDKHCHHLLFDLEYCKQEEYQVLYNKNKKVYKQSNVSFQDFAVDKIKTDLLEQIERSCKPNDFKEYKEFLQYIQTLEK